MTTTKPWAEGQFELKTHGVYVYEIYGWQDELIYIGISNDLTRRMNNHSTTSPWWPDAVTLRWTLYPTRFAAAHEEAKRISQKRPRENIAHNTTRVPVVPEPEPVVLAPGFILDGLNI